MKKGKQRREKKIPQILLVHGRGIPISGDGAESDRDLEFHLGRGAKPDTSSLY